jgi:hypothetical protein
MARKRRRLHRRYRNRDRSERSERPTPRRNPPPLTELAEFVLPGLGGFAATRLLTRIVAVQVAKRKPKWARHAAAATSIASFLGAWYGGNRVKFLEPYHQPIVVGAGLGAIVNLVQIYFPRLGWILSDPTAEMDASANAADLLPAASVEQQLAAAQLQPVNDDPGWYTFDDKYDAGRYAKETGASAPIQNGAPQTGAQQRVADEDDLLADLAIDGNGASAVNMGIFN